MGEFRAEVHCKVCGWRGSGRHVSHECTWSQEVIDEAVAEGRELAVLLRTMDTDPETGDNHG